MGAPEFHPSPAHSPSLGNSSNALWSSIARKNTIIDNQNWRTETFRCTCPLSRQPEFRGDCDPSDPVDLRRILFYAHKMDSFENAHADFEAVKDSWTPKLFGKMIGMIAEAQCTKLDSAVRQFHQSIRNNGLWQCWIDEVTEYPHFEALLLDELAHVLENLSPRYLKDVKIGHLLKIFGTSEEIKSTIHGKKRKLKRQITKWIETQPPAVLDANWEAVNALKWRLQRVIDQKDKEQEERSRNKQQYTYSWHRSKISRTPSPQSFNNKECWPELRKVFEGQMGQIPIGA